MVGQGQEEPPDGPNLEDAYRRYGPIIYRRCLRLLGHPGDAHDALHEVFIRLDRALPGFRGEADILTFIYRIATNHCLNRLRRRSIEARVLRTWRIAVADDPRPRHELSGLVRALLERLPPEEAQLLVHVHHDGMSQEQLAAAAGVSARTIRSRLSKAEARASDLLAALERAGEGEADGS